LSWSTIAEASAGARLLNNGAYVGAAAQRNTMKPPRASAIVPMIATTF
jgi:hypothetical protein